MHGRRSNRVGNRSAAAVALATLAGVAVGWNPLAAGVEPGDAVPSGRAPAAPSPADAAVRMKFFNATWADVLRRVADDSGSTLVMQDVPPGRFSRFDRDPHTRREAVRLLNRELEPEGFRILENGEHLVVLHGRSVRHRYQAPVAPGHTGRRLSTPVPPPAAVEVPRQRFTSITPNTAATGTAAGARAETLIPAALEDAGFPDDRPRGLLETVGFDGEQADAVRAAAAEPVGTVTVRTAKARSARVARRLYDALKPHARLIERGPAGLPAFEAYRPGDPLGGDVQFAVGIDTDRDELVVEGPGSRTRRIADLLRDLDRADTTDGTAVELMPADAKRAAIARQLNPVLRQLAMARRQDGRQGDAPQQGGGPARGEQPPMSETSDADAPADGRGPVAPADVQGIIQNLRSQVQVEQFGDQGVLIIRGNEEDVQAVMDLIRQLESLSAGLQPTITLINLRHVDSVPLAALLTEVYEQLATLRNRGEDAPSRIAVLPVGKPNAVLIVAGETDTEAVFALIEKLDLPVAPGTQFEVFRLRSAIASQAAELVTEFYDERPGLGPDVTVAADIRTNSLVVSAAPNDLAEIAKLVRKIDAGESGLVSRLEVFKLRAATAEELAETINTAVQSILNPAAAGQAGGGGFGGAGGQDIQDLQAARSVVLEFLGADGGSLRGGLLADVTVSPDPRTNSLIVTAPAETMPLVRALIETLDGPAVGQAEFKVFTLANADAEQAVELLRELFEAAETDGPGGIQVAGAEDPASALVPPVFSFDPRSNTVVARGGQDTLVLVEAILARLDDTSGRRQNFRTVKLINAPADQVALALDQVLTARRELLTVQPGLISAQELIRQEVVVIPEVFSNRLIVYADPGFMDEVIRLIREIDETPPQVTIQALLVEVSLDNTDEFGIELGFQDSTLFDRSVTTANDTLTTITQTLTNPATGVQTTNQNIISQTATPGFLFNNGSPLGNNVAANPSSVGTQALSNFGLGRANAELGFGGFVFQASSANVNVLLRALASKREVHVLSRPQVTVLDNNPAEIQVGQNVPIITGGNVNTLGGFSPIISYDSAGLILNVVPRISPDGTIFMNISAENSAYTQAGTPIFTDPTTGAVVSAPIKNVSFSSTTVSAPNGQTIVLGGIITESDDTIERKVPYLGDVPYLGQLFRTDSTRKQRSELLIFLTPRIIYTDADFELVKQVEADRLHYLEHEAEAIHGPLFGVPPNQEPGPFEGPGGFAPPTGGGMLPPGAAPYCPPGDDAAYGPTGGYDDGPATGPAAIDPYGDIPLGPLDPPRNVPGPAPRR